MIAATRVTPALIALPLAILLGCAHNIATGSQTEPRDGTELLQRMHDAYAGKWYNTVTFVQKTTTRPPDGSDKVSTWYESQMGDRLRIDMGDPAAGNGVLYTADSAYAVRAGKVVRSRAEGNPFLPLVVSVYMKPMATTLAQLAPYHYDLSRIRKDMWEGRPTYVVGARDVSDLESPQIWVDADRLVVTRFLVALVPNGKSRVQDVRMENYVRAGGGWLETRVRMLDGGQPMQTEDYTDWHADVKFPPGFFEAEHWSEGKHWATP